MYCHQKISLFPVLHLLIIHPSWQGWRSPINSDFKIFFIWFKIAKDKKILIPYVQNLLDLFPELALQTWVVASKYYYQSKHYALLINIFKILIYMHEK